MVRHPTRRTTLRSSYCGRNQPPHLRRRLELTAHGFQQPGRHLHRHVADLIRRWRNRVDSPRTSPTIRYAMPANTLFSSDLLVDHGNTEQKLAFVVDMMRELSRQTDPQVMVADYG